jgi:segregation and condensation protein B
MSESAADYSTQGVSTAAPASLEARLEALLFVSAAPVAAQRLAEALGVPGSDVDAALARLEQTLEPRGVRIQKHRGGYSLTTSPLAAADVARLLDLDSTALETLSIVAYRQPATRPLIDSIRGVNSEASLHTLIRYGLVEEAGRSEGPGRPFLYVTTQDFLRQFGLGSLDDLPVLEFSPEAPAEGPSDPDEVA